MDLTKGSCSDQEEEEEGRKEGERRAPNKAGPMRPPLLNGIKWEYQRLLIRFIQSS